MGKTVRQLLRETTSAELAEWKAFYALEPFGDMVADQRTGMVSATLANVHRDAKAHPEAYKPSDFIPWHEVHRKPVDDCGVFVADPEAQARLIKQALFKSN